MLHTQNAPTDTTLWQVATEGQLSVDVFETEDAMVIQSAIAGIAAKDLDIFVNPEMVTIRGMRRRDVRAAGATMHFEECFWGGFSRSIVLPVPIVPGRTQAELKDGILTITLPKADADVRHVPIQTL